MTGSRPVMVGIGRSARLLQGRSSHTVNIGKKLRAAATGALLAPAAVALAAGPAQAVVSSADTAASATTLAQVRTIIGADTGTAATLTGKGVGVALIDTGVGSVPGLPAAQIV